MEGIHILLISSSPEIASLTQCLQADRYTVATVADASVGIAQALSGAYTLVILDLPLPTMSGLEALRQIRQHSLVPVLILSDTLHETERIMALEFGADDYLPKPIVLPEFTARIRTILRRAHTGVSVFGNLVKASALELNRGTHRVKLHAEDIALTASEFELLEFLVKRAGQAVSREDLSQQIFGRPLNPNDRSIDVHLSNLRKKLMPHSGAASCQIKAIRGVGYTFILL